MYIENVTTIKVDSEAAVLALLAKGSKARSVGETQVHIHRDSVLYLLIILWQENTRCYM